MRPALYLFCMSYKEVDEIQYIFIINYIAQRHEYWVIGTDMNQKFPICCFLPTNYILNLSSFYKGALCN